MTKFHVHGFELVVEVTHSYPTRAHNRGMHDQFTFTRVRGEPIYFEAKSHFFLIAFKQVTACLNSYLEVRPCRPRIEKLKQLLSEYLYKGPEAEVDYVPYTDSDRSEVVENPAKRRKGPQKVNRQFHQ